MPGLVPVVALAVRASLHRLIREHLRVPGVAGSNPVTKVVALTAGMLAEAANINTTSTGASRSRSA